MAVTYSLAPEPFWILLNLVGEAAGGAKMYTRRSLNHDEDKIVYQDAGGTTAWTNPIVFNLNGVAPGPFYWQYDSAQPDELYYIFINDADGNLLWSINDFNPGSGSGGGGGNVTTYLPLSNYIANNQFIDHIGTTVTTSLTNLVVAPSNHKGFTPSAVPVIGTYGVLGTDIRFLKNSTANTDNISFPTFALSSAPLGEGVTPVDYVRYQCTTANPGENYKCFQFPITQKVKNLSNQIMSFNIWATSPGAASLEVYVRQYFGSGSAASPDLRTLVGSFALTSSWASYNLTLTIPTVAGKSLGTAGLQTDDDALYIQLEMPHGVACDILFTKPSLYLGDIDPDQEFETYDQINSINSTPRCGDVKIGYYPVAPGGWLAMNDTSIGNVSSGATTEGAYTFQLYKTLWDSVSDTWAPVSTGRGATAVADFLAGKTLTMPRALGRALAGAGAGSGLTARALGEYLGAETISISAMPSHSHAPLAPASTFLTGVASGGSGLASGAATIYSSAATTATTGGSAADGNMPPISFMQVYIKL